MGQDSGGLFILGSETAYFLVPQFRLEWVCLVKNVVLCLIVAFHVGTFYECHCL